MRPPRALLASLAALALLTRPAPASACATAPPRGHDAFIDAEEALILWDPASRTEHFLRRAQFDTSAPDLGFLVPTPAPPVLAEADANVFARLDEATRPRVREERPLTPRLTCLTMFMRGGAKESATAADVRVLSIQTIAGYEAAVLQADDAKALRAWLEAHGYEVRPTLVDWLAPYLANRWTITAFKIAEQAKTDAPRHRPASAAVRLTFTTDRPFYPYREPIESQRADAARGRKLRVFFVTPDGRSDGAIGAAKARWPATLEYARPRTDLRALLQGAIPESAIPTSAWLHDYLDPSSPRPGTDELWFTRAAAQDEIVPPEIVMERPREIYVPVDLIALGGVAVWLVVRVSRRAR